MGLFAKLFKKKKNEETVAVESERKPVQKEKKESTIASINVPEKKTTETKKVEEVKKEKVVETPKAETKVEVKEETKKPAEQKAETKVEVKEEKAPEEAPKTEKKSLPGKYEVFQVNGVYLYRLKASNGEIMVTSELYKSEKGALDAIETVKKNVETGNFITYQDKHGLWQFKLYAVNKRLLAVSANYNSKDRVENAIQSFKRFALNSNVEVLEEDPLHLMEEIEIVKEADKKGGKIQYDEEAFDGSNEVEFRLVASNGKVLCSSMSYKTKDALLGQVEDFKNAVNDGKFYVVKDKNNKYQFKLYSKSGRCLVVGESYDNKTNAISAANSVAAFANLAE